MERKMIKEKILIIEPDQVLADEVVDILGKEGTELTVVHSHFKALAMLEDESFSMVLVSADDSGIDGLEFCRIYRKRQVESGRDLPYLILLGHNWQMVNICESQAHAHDFLVRPYLACELEWRVENGLRTVGEMRFLREMIYLDPETRALNQLGLEKILREEINRLGRKKGWISLAVLDFEDREWMQVSQSKEMVDWTKQQVVMFLKETLRNYDQVAQVDQERICILSGDCDYHCFTGLLNRIEACFQELDLSFTTVKQPDIRLTGIIHSILVDSRGGGSDMCFEHLWNWIKSIDRLPETKEFRISLLDKNGLRDSEYGEKA